MNAIRKSKPKILKDPIGRVYTRVDPFPEGPARKAAWTMPPGRCADCGRKVQHGFELYYQRSVPLEFKGSDPLVKTTAVVNFDDVCGECGDRELRRP